MARWLIGLSLWISVTASAQDDFYFTVQEPQSPALENFSFDALDNFEILKAKIEQTVNLMDFLRHEEPMPAPPEKYNRLQHFGTWKIVRDCYDTRTLVLMRDSKGPVKYKTGNHCKVDSGQWHDPYTGKNVSKASDIQIDHVVALKNAYISGAWAWNYKARCLYANFMGNKFHLLPVWGIENQRKGDKSPEGYMPPQASFKCEYLKYWLEIKLIWNLALTPSETAAIQNLVQQNNCSASQLTTKLKQIIDQRQTITANEDLCGQ